MRKPIADRLWSKVDKTSGYGPGGDCWIWTAHKSPSGYGRISLGKGAGVTGIATRVVWELTFGPIGAGLCVLHKCDNPPCCNPAHLFLGTKTDNAADKVAKGRQMKGTQSGNAIFTEAQILQIRLLSTCGYSNKELAVAYGCSRPTISNIVTRTTWKHI